MVIVLESSRHGGDVAINTSKITHLTRNHIQEDSTLVHFGKDNYVSVDVKFEELVVLISRQED